MKSKLGDFLNGAIPNKLGIEQNKLNKFSFGTNVIITVHLWISPFIPVQFVIGKFLKSNGFFTIKNTIAIFIKTLKLEVNYLRIS